MPAATQAELKNLIWDYYRRHPMAQGEDLHLRLSHFHRPGQIGPAAWKQVVNQARAELVLAGKLKEMAGIGGHGFVASLSTPFLDALDDLK